MIFDPKSVGDGARVLIEAVLESGNASAEILGGRMAMMIGNILPEPAPEGLDRHECSRAMAQGRCVTLRLLPAPHRLDDRKRRPTRRSACPRAIRFGVGAEHRRCAHRWR